MRSVTRGAVTTAHPQHHVSPAHQLLERARRRPGQEEPLRALKAYYEETGDHPSLGRLMEGWAERTHDPQQAANYFREAARHVLRGDADIRRAAYLLERALQCTPHDRALFNGLLQQLDQLGDATIHKHAAQRLLLRLQESPQQDPNWVAYLEHHLGRIYERDFGQPRKALARYRLALEQNPRFLPAIRDARRLYSEAHAHRAVSLLRELEVNATADRRAKVELLLELAAHQERQLGDLDGAILSLRRALRLEPNRIREHWRLARLLLARLAEKHDPLDGRRAAAVFMHLSQLTRGKRAQAFAQHCLELDPKHPSARSRLKEATQEANDEATQAPLPLPVEGTHSQPPRLTQPTRQLWVTTASARSAGPVAQSAAPPNQSRQRRAVCAWMHTEHLPPQHTDTTPLEPPETLDDESVPEVGTALGVVQPGCRIPVTLPSAAHRPQFKVHLAPGSAAHLYVGVDGSLLNGGVFITMRTQLAPGTEVLLELTFDEGTQARALGSIQTTGGQPSVPRPMAPGVLIAFTALEPEGLGRIELYARQHPPLLCKT